MGDEEEPVAIWAPNGCVVRLAQPRRALADGAEHGLNIGRGACDDAEDFAGRRLLLQRLSEMLLRLGEFAGSLVKLFLEVGCHRCAIRRCTGLASGHATNAIDVTSGKPLMKPSQEVQDHAGGTEIYHLRAGHALKSAALKKSHQRVARTQPRACLRSKKMPRSGASHGA